MLALAWFNIRFTVLSKHSLIDLPLRHRFQYKTCLLPGHQLGFKSSMADRWSHFSQSSQNVQYGLYSNFKLSSWWQTIVDLAHTQMHTQKQTNKTAKHIEHFWVWCVWNRLSLYFMWLQHIFGGISGSGVHVPGSSKVVKKNCRDRIFSFCIFQPLLSFLASLSTGSSCCLRSCCLRAHSCWCSPAAPSWPTVRLGQKAPWPQR